MIAAAEGKWVLPADEQQSVIAAAAAAADAVRGGFACATVVAEKFGGSDERTGQVEVVAVPAAAVAG